MDHHGARFGARYEPRDAHELRWSAPSILTQKKRRRRWCITPTKNAGGRCLTNTYENNIPGELNVRPSNLPPFPDYMAPSSATAPMASANSRWRAGACRVHRSSAAHRSRTSATSRSAHWRGWLSPAHRCVVPWTSFCEYADTKPRKTPTWFALDDSRPLAVFAGIWSTWHGRRGTKANAVEGEHQLFGFLTTDANDVVGAIHPKAMPVILTSPEEIEIWMTAPAEEALKLQRPLPNGTLNIVARGEKEDGTYPA